MTMTVKYDEKFVLCAAQGDILIVLNSDMHISSNKF